MKYKVARARTNSDLEKAVNKLIKLGWNPQGGVSVSFVEYAQPLLAQAMVKCEQ